MDELPSKTLTALNLRKGREDVFFFKNMNKDEFINESLKCRPMCVGKFLVPEFAKYLNMTIDDLKELRPLIDNIDEKHKYEKIIYDSYIKNNEFALTDEQKQLAYNEYKKLR